ncbi:uncharacterized protein FOMMEDRAFT_104658 [Fomitiporia mediterranea MF3/22]|uniref:uncharacterized protein n=1 Tax=Fomitiporia mediterranea (strain MF3/22) TaxID=694068 RepID=UPI0004408319|nr:uncharacterized protein FOMMEDRAFT_104658 [Fomitiporia mediterranea MF3/22]EJD06160.1 hypothetical protein FOMMEDRAFT_104658 [Fomitiporia mediterranea MF3/22]
MTTEHVVDLCQSAPTIAEELAKDPSRAASDVIKGLRKEWKDKRGKNGSKSGERKEQDRLDRAASCGKFPNRPSDLFLEVYADVLDSISNDPFANLVSPSLIGSSGVIPLSIISVIPDIMRHYADLIARAHHEVFLATNYWEDSHSASLVSDALRALSKRCIEEGRKDEQKVVVKLVYDRGTPEQLFQNHAAVPTNKWESVGLPRVEDLSGLRMEVLNYHRPPLGTFHAKYIVVDRKVACVNSNNIQDRPNVEMCVHFEGPIVESFYDAGLFSWANKMEPSLPLLAHPPPQRDDYKFGEENEHLKYIDTQYAGVAARALLAKQYEREAQEVEGPGKDKRGATQRADGSIVGHVVRAAAGIHGGDTGVHGKDELVAEHPAMNFPDGSSANNNDASEADEDLEKRQDRERNIEDGDKDTRESDKQEPDLEERQARPMATSNTQGTTNDVSNQSTLDRVTDGPEILKSEETSSSTSSRRVEAITKHLNAATLHEQGTADDDESMDEFRPHVMHASHRPVPMAMVNRAPKGTPGHESVDEIPQNVAWISLFKHAKESIFIQSPTFNAAPVIPATLDACRRGVQVTLYLDLGFNDLGEMIPFQGGTNEQVVHSMYNTLNKEGKQENLKVYWYTAKDQKEPMSATRKSRNCHGKTVVLPSFPHSNKLHFVLEVKFMSVDSQVVMLGNGNQDTQSWFHSQEINVLIDSAELAREWIIALNANQNTEKFGLVDAKDGVWRAADGSGRVVESSGVKQSGPFGGLKGIAGAIRRVRGTGGF